MELISPPPSVVVTTVVSPVPAPIPVISLLSPAPPILTPPLGGPSGPPSPSPPPPPVSPPPLSTPSPAPSPIPIQVPVPAPPPPVISPAILAIALLQNRLRDTHREFLWMQMQRGILFLERAIQARHMEISLQADATASFRALQSIDAEVAEAAMSLRELSEAYYAVWIRDRSFTTLPLFPQFLTLLQEAEHVYAYFLSQSPLEP